MHYYLPGRWQSFKSSNSQGKMSLNDTLAFKIESRTEIIQARKENGKWDINPFHYQLEENSKHGDNCLMQLGAPAFVITGIERDTLTMLRKQDNTTYYLKRLHPKK